MREAEVAIFVTRRGRSEVLIAHRSPAQGSYWHTIAGGIEAGETPLEAAARFETYTIAGARGSGEIKVNGAAARLVHTGDTIVEYAYALSEEPPERAGLYPDGLLEVRVHCFVADAPDEWEPALDWEHDDHRWCAPHEAAATLRWPETADALRRLVP